MKNQGRAIGLTILSAFLLSACDDIANSPQKNTVQGAGIGAATGALAGLILGDSKKDVVIGTIAGTAIGGVVGNRLDKQEQALRDSLSSKDTTIRNTGSELVVTLPEGITFDTDSTYVRNDFRPEIYKIANNLREYSDTTVDVIGHTDSSGSEEYNQALSADRAYSVTDILTDQGVSDSRIVSYGRGETTPIASNDDEFGKSKNRRVEIIIRPAA
ncbi:OmpA family protein [Amylibacter sp. SFDW26]|uniref:OmpA family protein n=1 Tax=Amylibacter sp. SFDW26 TaxID=2652722 RepID=UPI0012623AE1|nr:OmpA family protein [Amylibacter sp. SFDW26]KAB7613895.1 OmpA family protein [Amylibacter sp. SFDW26]